MDAYKRAGLLVNDIDVFVTHDCFTSAEYAAISALGLTEPSKGYEVVENRTIDRVRRIKAHQSIWRLDIQLKFLEHVCSLIFTNR